MPILSNSNISANLSSPARSYLWNIIISNPIGGGDADTLMLRCQSTQIPERSFNPIEVPWQQDSKLQYPGKLNYTYDWACEFVEGEDGAILNSFYDWANTIIDDTTAVGGDQSNIISDIYLQLIGTDGTQWGQYWLQQCWIKSMGQIALSYDGESIIKVPITFRYNKWNFQGNLS
jgi:hypothetical protein